MVRQLQAIKVELRKRMHDPIAKTGAWVEQMLKGQDGDTSRSRWWACRRIGRLEWNTCTRPHRDRVLPFFDSHEIKLLRDRLVWVYRTYFSEDERAGLDLRLEPRSYWYQPEAYLGLIAVSLVGAVLTAVYLWSVR